MVRQWDTRRRGVFIRKQRGCEERISMRNGSSACAAGLASLGALGLFMTGMIGSEAGLGGVQWGAYLAAGLALLTTITGLSGMRGR